MPNSFLTISHQEAFEITEAIIKKALSDGGAPVAIAVVDAAGYLKTFASMDNVPFASIRLSQSKAYSAVIGGKDTSHWASTLKNHEVIDFDMRNWTDPKLTGFTGGVILIKNKMIIGGIGVSGRKGKMGIDDNILQDQELCQFGKELFNL